MEFLFGFGTNLWTHVSSLITMLSTNDFQVKQPFFCFYAQWAFMEPSEQKLYRSLNVRWYQEHCILEYLSHQQFHEHWLFSLPLSNLQHLFTFHQCMMSLACHLEFVAPNTLPFSWRHSGYKRSLTCAESLSDSLRLLTKIRPPHEPQTWNNFSHTRHFVRLSSLRHLDGEKQH
jgi:hypothetical protein